MALQLTIIYCAITEAGIACLYMHMFFNQTTFYKYAIKSLKPILIFQTPLGIFYLGNMMPLCDVSNNDPNNDMLYCNQTRHAYTTNTKRTQEQANVKRWS